MQISIALLCGVLVALAVLAGVVALCLVGVGEALLFVQSATGIDLGAQRTLKIIHATDIHYISPKLTDNGSYFTAMVENSDGKVMLAIEALADAFVTQVLAEAPDVLVLSGDLTFNGARDSHLDFIEKLRVLTDAGIAVYVMPGNHDLNCLYAASFAGDTYTLVDSITAEDFRTLYADFGYAGETVLSAHADSLSYMAQVGDTQALLFVDVNASAIPGVLSDDTLAWAEQQLIAAKTAGLQVIAVSHQNLLDHNDMLTYGYTIVKVAPLLALYEQYGVLCNLSGHVHMQHIATSEGGIADIATGALSVYANQYGVLSWGGDALSYQTTPIEMPLWGETAQAQQTQCDTFAEYSVAFFQGGHGFAVAEKLAGLATDAEIAEIEAWILESNTHYFAGRRDLMTKNEPALALLQQSGSFVASYIESIFADAQTDDTTWVYPAQV